MPDGVILPTDTYRAWFAPHQAHVTALLAENGDAQAQSAAITAGNNPVGMSDPSGRHPLTDAELASWKDSHKTGLAAAGAWVADNWEYLVAGAAIVAGVALMFTDRKIGRATSAPEADIRARPAGPPTPVNIRATPATIAAPATRYSQLSTTHAPAAAKPVL